MLQRLSLFVAVLAGVPTAVGADDPPMNVLVIMTDEHNFRTLGCYRELLSPEQALMWGDAVVDTPNIDWLAEQGAICTSFYATTPVCSPSRAAFVSGRYPQNTPVVTNNVPLADNIVTFAELLRRKGYVTGYAGKWHLDGGGKPQWAPQRKFGFDDNRFMFNRGHWKRLEITASGPRVAARNNAGAPTYSVEGADEKSFTTDFLTDRALDFLKAHDGQPFCYMLSIPDPHGPDTVRAPYGMMFADQQYSAPRTFDKSDEGLPSWGQKQGGGYDMASYYGMVKCIDDNVGRIVQHLRQAGRLENTVIVFTSDHGDLRGEHHRQNKGVPYEGSSRVPFLIYCPGKIAARTVVKPALTSVDFLPTLMSLLQVSTAGQEQGRDASKLFTGDTDAVDWHDLAFIRGTGEQQGWIAAVTDRYKLVYSPVDPPWLFDLERDPDEVINFFPHAGYRDTVKRLSSALQDYAKKYHDPFIHVPRVKADVQWAISGSGDYRPPNLPAVEGKPQKGKKAKPPKRKRAVSQ